MVLWQFTVKLYLKMRATTSLIPSAVLFIPMWLHWTNGNSTLNGWEDIPVLSPSVDRIVACEIASSSLTLTQDQMVLQIHEIEMAYGIRWYMITISKWISTMPLLGECESCVTYLIRQSLSQPYLMEPGSFASSICRTLAQKIFIRLSHPSHRCAFNTTSIFYST